MTTDTFVQRFNSGNPRDKGQLFIDLDLQEPDINLMVPAPPGSAIIAFYFNGYLKIGAGVWYVLKEDDKRVPMSAFKMHADGLKTYEAWLKTTPRQIMNFTAGVKKLFIQAFEGCVLPEYLKN
jgi:hypothetical protein